MYRYKNVLNHQFFTQDLQISSMENLAQDDNYHKLLDVITHYNCISDLHVIRMHLHLIQFDPVPIGTSHHLVVVILLAPHQGRTHSTCCIGIKEQPHTHTLSYIYTCYKIINPFLELHLHLHLHNSHKINAFELVCFQTAEASGS